MKTIHKTVFSFNLLDIIVNSLLISHTSKFFVKNQIKSYPDGQNDNQTVQHSPYKYQK